MFDRMQLLRDLDAGTTRRHHFDDVLEMSFRAFETLDNIWMAMMKSVSHKRVSIESRGVGYRERSPRHEIVQPDVFLSVTHYASNAAIFLPCGEHDPPSLHANSRNPSRLQFHAQQFDRVQKHKNVRSQVKYSGFDRSDIAQQRGGDAKNMHDPDPDD